MGLKCSSCGYDNDPTRVYCHSCGSRLERGAQAPPAPTGYMHPTDVVKMKKPGEPFAWGRSVAGIVRLLVLGGLAVAVVLALLPPRDLPVAVAPDTALADRLTSLVANSAQAGGKRSFSVPAADLNTWLVSSIVLQPQSEGMIRLDPQRVYAVSGQGDVRVGLETKFPVGLRLYFEGCYAPVAEGDGTALVARSFAVGRLPLPAVAGILVRRQFGSLVDALAGPLGDLSAASSIVITPQSVTLRWSGSTR